MATPKLYTSEVTQYGNTRILNSIRVRLLSMETPETLYERGYSVWKHQNIKLYTSEVTQYGNTRNSIRARLLSMETPEY